MTIPTIETKKKTANKRSALSIRRLFTKEGTHPFDEIMWVTRDAVVESGDKKVFAVVKA